MKSIWYFPVIFIGLGLVYIIALILQKSFLVPVTGITHFLDGLIFIFGAMKINKSLAANNSKDLSMKYFMWFFASTGIFQVMMGLPHLLLYKSAELFPQAIAWAYMEGHIFLYIGLAYTIIVPLQLYYPERQKIKKSVFSFFLIFGAVITWINIFNPNAPVFDVKSGITLLNADALVGILIPIIATLSWLPTGVIFIYKGIKARQDHFIFVRSLLIGSGLLIMLFSGPQHDIATTALRFFIADIFTMLGFLTCAAGVFYKSGQSEEAALAVGS